MGCLQSWHSPPGSRRVSTHARRDKGLCDGEEFTPAPWPAGTDAVFSLRPGKRAHTAAWQQDTQSASGRGAPGPACQARCAVPLTPPRKSTGTNSSRPSNLATVAHSRAEQPSSPPAGRAQRCLPTCAGLGARRVCPGRSLGGKPTECLVSGRRRPRTRLGLCCLQRLAVGGVGALSHLRAPCLCPGRWLGGKQTLADSRPRGGQGGQAVASSLPHWQGEGRPRKGGSGSAPGELPTDHF